MTQIFCNGNITLPLEDIFKELLFLNVTLYSHPSRGGTATTWCDKVCFTSAILVSSISKTNHYYININEILSKVTLRNNNSLNISSKGRVMLPLQNICVINYHGDVPFSRYHNPSVIKGRKSNSPKEKEQRDKQ
jgi:hypothetical protein